MNEPNHVKSYVEALNAARTFLGEIQAKFELLESQRESMQRVADSLSALIEAEPQSIAQNPQAAVASPEPRSEPIDPHFFVIENPIEPVPSAKEQVEDPSLDSIERRISKVLGMAAVA